MGEVVADGYGHRCIICEERHEEPLYRLDCRHGGLEGYSMHLRCLKNFFRFQLQAGQAEAIHDLKCPVCRTLIKHQEADDILM